MKKLMVRICAALFVMASLTLLTQAQNRERFGISARAGGVNAVSGQVMIKREGQAPQLLTSQDNLNSGDVVNTGFGSQAEILLNPGTYLRLGQKTEFQLVDNSIENLQVKLTKGSVIIEATGSDGVELRIPIVTPEQRMTIVRPGVYRINVTPGVTELVVRKGRMMLGNDAKNIVKSGKKLTITSFAPGAIAKLTKDDKDDFDTWSKERGQTLARANERLSRRGLNGFLSNSPPLWTEARFGRWGYWTWSSFAGCYTFLPFYYGWGSPYGGSYGMFAGFGGFYSNGGCCRMRVYDGPTIVHNPPYNGGFPGSTGSTGTGTGPSVSGGPSLGGPINSGPPIRSQAGPRDPDGGGRSINRIREPN
jgi:FecR protein